jgi:CHAD domain-containing protein
MDEIALTLDKHIAETGRYIMSDQLAIIQENEVGVRTCGEMTAVHEMRKAIRRTFTCFKLFGPYFDPAILNPFRRSLRRIMSRLASSRDLAVFRLNLDLYNQSVERPLDDLAAFWEIVQKDVDGGLMGYLAKPEQQTLLAQYYEFTQTPGIGVLKSKNAWAPVKTRHVVPGLVNQRIALVRAFDDHLQGATAKQMHRLRIRFKDLRYTLEFFAPLLGEAIETALLNLKQSQDHLGLLNDTTVALRLLNEMVGLEEPARRYRAYQENEQERLIQSFLPVWRGFDQPLWRQNVAQAIATL